MSLQATPTHSTSRKWLRQAARASNVLRTLAAWLLHGKSFATKRKKFSLWLPLCSAKTKRSENHEKRYYQTNGRLEVCTEGRKPEKTALDFWWNARICGNWFSYRPPTKRWTKYFVGHVDCGTFGQNEDCGRVFGTIRGLSWPNSSCDSRTGRWLLTRPFSNGRSRERNMARSLWWNCLPQFFLTTWTLGTGSWIRFERGNERAPKITTRNV